MFGCNGIVYEHGDVKCSFASINEFGGNLLNNERVLFEIIHLMIGLLANKCLRGNVVFNGRSKVRCDETHCVRVQRKLRYFLINAEMGK